MFSADSAPAETWMRKRYKSRSVVYLLPSEYEAAVAFKRAAEAESFSIFVMANRRAMGTS